MLDAEVDVAKKRRELVIAERAVADRKHELDIAEQNKAAVAHRFAFHAEKNITKKLAGEAKKNKTAQTEDETFKATDSEPGGEGTDLEDDVPWVAISVAVGKSCV